MNKVYGMVFKENGKIYNFISDNENFSIGDKIIVETEKGVQLGRIVCEVNDEVDTSNMKTILRKATEEDYNQYLENLKLAEEALNITKEEVENLGIDMRVLNASYTFDRKQLLFNFIANERVDFRELVKRLASLFHTRIELRQIGVRDKAKEISGLGQCGRKLCCSSFLDNIETVSINMAKNQDIALNPNKISGACGRLLCCLTYEDEEYSRCKKCLPQVGQYIETDHGKGVVIGTNILQGKYKIDINNEIYEVTVDNCSCHGE